MTELADYTKGRARWDTHKETYIQTHKHTDGTKTLLYCSLCVKCFCSCSDWLIVIGFHLDVACGYEYRPTSDQWANSNHGRRDLGTKHPNF